MRNFKRSLLSGLLAGCSTTLLFGAATSAAAQSRNDGQGATEIREVVVTARRRAENLMETPVTVTALDEQALQQQVVQSLTDLQTSVPGLNMGANTTTGGRKAIAISLRGVRSAAVTLYSSEIVRNPLTLFDSMFDLESVQVLKGPQGTLFGSNSTSGAILIQPARPSSAFEGFLEGTVGNYDLRGGTGVVNLPFAEWGGLRIAANASKRDGFVKGATRDYDSDDHNTIRVSLKLEPTDWLSNLLVAERYEFEGQGAAISPVGYTPCGTPPGATAPCLYAARPLTYVAAFDAEAANGPFRTNFTEPYPQSINNDAVSNITEVKIGRPLGDFIGDISFKSILGYGDFENHSRDDADGTVLVLTEQNRIVTEERKSAELQIQGSGMDERLNWVVGGYFADVDATAFNRGSTLAEVAPATAPGRTQAKTTERQSAYYGQVSAKILENVGVTLGYRSTLTKRTDVSSIRGGVALTCSFTPAPGVDFASCVRTSAQKNRQPTWTAGVDWNYRENGLIYFVTRKGFNAGGFNTNALTADTLAYRPETLTDIELGIKQDFMLGDVPVRATLAVFDESYKSIQRRNIITFVLNGANRLVPLIINAASAKITGADVGFEIRPTSALTVNVAATFLNPRYKKFNLQNGPTAIDLSDNVLGQAPKFSSNVGVSYEFDEMGAMGKPRVSLNYAYQGKVAFLDVNAVNSALSNAADPSNVQGGYGLFNGEISFAGIGNSNAHLSIWARNLTNKFYFNSKAGFLGTAAGSPGEPRTFGATLRYKFG